MLGGKLQIDWHIDWHIDRDSHLGHWQISTPTPALTPTPTLTSTPSSIQPESSRWPIRPRTASRVSAKTVGSGIEQKQNHCNTQNVSKFHSVRTFLFVLKQHMMKYILNRITLWCLLENKTYPTKHCCNLYELNTEQDHDTKHPGVESSNLKL